jgi:hypothetical protein
MKKFGSNRFSRKREKQIKKAIQVIKKRPLLVDFGGTREPGKPIIQKNIKFNFERTKTEPNTKSF